MNIKLKKALWLIKTQTISKFFYGKIGKKTYIAPTIFTIGCKNAYLNDFVRILPNMRLEIHNGGEIYFNGNNSIGQNLHIICSNERLEIGYGTTISSNVFISNTDHIYTKNKSALQTELSVKKTVIGDYCFIGYGVAVLPGTILGDNVIVGANSTVKGTFPSNVIIAGTPAKIIKRL